jgi:hypothetical protein
MAGESRFVGNAIEEMLVALADGVREAQVALNAGPLLDPAGRPLATYQLPYLDFTIAVEMQTKVDSGGRPIALLAPSTSSQSNSAVRSNVSGRLIAAPPGDGLPVPRLVLTVTTNNGGAAEIAVRVSNSAGEVLANQRVELNIDDAASVQLSGVRGGEFRRLAGTRLTEAVLTSDPHGMATTRLLIDAAQGKRDVAVVIANIGPFSARGAVPLGSVG